MRTVRPRAATWTMAMARGRRGYDLLRGVSFRGLLNEQNLDRRR